MWQNQIKLVQIIPRDKFVIKSWVMPSQMCWCDVEVGEREGGQVTQDREHRNTGALAMSNLTLLYPTIHRHSPLLSPPPFPLSSSSWCPMWLGWVFNQYPNIILPTTGPIILALPGYTSWTVSDWTIRVQSTAPILWYTWTWGPGGLCCWRMLVRID